MDGFASPPVTGLVIAAALLTAAWVVSLPKKDASVVDAFWGPAFAVLAWTYWALGRSESPRAALVPILVTLWGVRLAAHILWRSRGKPEDYRYRAMRERWGRRFPWVSLPTVFLLQAAIAWAVAMPLYQVQRATATWSWLDLAGLACFLVGLSFESVGDWQLARFKSNPGNRGKLLTSGLWRYTRHPNYFGDAMVWWGLFLFALATPGSWWTAYSPALMTFLLMKVSGVALLERGLSESKPGYERYVARTNAFFPWFPKSHTPR